MKFKVIGIVIFLLLFGTNLVQARDLLVGSVLTNEILRYDQQTGNFIAVFAAEPAKLQDPTIMVFGPDGHLYVVGQATHNVVRFDGQTGAFIDEFVLPAEGGLNFPTFLIFGPDKNLYVSSLTDQVLRFDGTTGAFIDVFAQGNGLSVPLGMAFGPDGNFYVASRLSDAVLRYDGITGAFIDVFASATSASFPSSLSFSRPNNLVFGPDGHLYTNSGTSVVRFNGQTGAFIDVFVAEGSGGMINTSQLIFGPDEILYITDFFAGGITGATAGGAVLRFDSITGGFIDKFVPATSGGLDGVGGLTFFPAIKPSEIWSKQGGTTGKDSATAVAVGDGLYVAGVTAGTLAGQSSSGGQDGFLRKYDLNGGEVCTNQFGTTGDETITGVKVTDTTVFVSGHTTSVFSGNTSSGGNDLFVRQYDLNCQPGWTKQFGTADNDIASSGLGLTPDGTSIFAGGTTDDGLGGTSAIIQKLDTNGNLLCSNQFGTGNVHDGGIILNSPSVSFAGTSAVGPFGGADGFINQFDLNCTQNWTTQFGTAAGDEIVSGLGVGPNDNAPEAVFVGSSTTAAYPNKVNAGASDFVLQRYNFTTGALDWTRQFGTLMAEKGGIVLNSPFVWMGGTTTGAFPGFENSGGTDIVIRKYGLDGTELYTTQFGTDQDDQILAIAKTPDSSSIFVVGDTMGAFAGQTNQGGQDFYVKRLEVTSDPVITVPDDIIAEATGPQTSVNIGQATATDDTSFPENIIIMNNSPATFPLGSTEVTWIATDEDGNSASATQSVTVVDTTPPVVTAPANVVVSATGPYTAAPLGSATATDLVDGALTPAPDITGPFPIGITTVTWTATDEADNSSSATQTVTIATVAFDPGVLWARAKLKPTIPNEDKLKVRGNLVLGLTSNGIDPVNEYVTFRLGTFTETIPPGSFVRKKERWVYKAPETEPFSGIKQIVLRDSSEYHSDTEHEDGEYKIKLKGLDLSGIDFSIPVPFSIQIADDRGEFRIPFDNTKLKDKIFEQKVDKHDEDDELDEHEFDED